jgi:hypothetical protein
MAVPAGREFCRLSQNSLFAMAKQSAARRTLDREHRRERSRFADVQLLDSSSGCLKIVAHRGFDGEFLRDFEKS